MNRGLGENTNSFQAIPHKIFHRRNERVKCVQAHWSGAGRNVLALSCPFASHSTQFNAALRFPPTNYEKVCCEWRRDEFCCCCWCAGPTERERGHVPLVFIKMPPSLLLLSQCARGAALRETPITRLRRSICVCAAVAFLEFQIINNISLINAGFKGSPLLLLIKGELICAQTPCRILFCWFNVPLLLHLSANVRHAFLWKCSCRFEAD